ncbi:hypothetical protein [Enterovirga rhinocerotis]|uniref:hypothetical protein n=1 Tax=Enterovirga rhinocerotis TaxID=1339210 RepID=UPI00105EABA5|nr:hypothetical protein [Enterovirga rhinocerotis]
MQTNRASPPGPTDPDLPVFAYLLALSETDERPKDDAARPGDLRRRAGGGFWIFDGERWIEW